jgi:hypothetical protein
MAVGGVRTTTETTKKGDKHMKRKNKYIGLDVHKDTTVIAVAEGERGGDVRLYGTISSDLHALDGARSAEMAKPESEAKGESSGCLRSGQ